jgi:hypothetical protein
MHMPEGMKACPGNLQCIAQWPQPLLNNLPGRGVWPTFLIYEQKALLSVANDFPQHLP